MYWKTFYFGSELSHMVLIGTKGRVPTSPGKPGKMTIAFPVMEFKNYEKYRGKVRGNLENGKFSYC